MPRRRPRTTPADSDIIDQATESAEPEAPVEVAEPEPEPEPEPEIQPVEKPTAAKSRKVASDVGTVETKEEPQPVRPKPPVTHREGVPNGLILNPEDELILEGDDNGTHIVVSRDVYRIVYPYGARRPTYLLLYPRGTQVPKTMLQRK